MPTRALTPRLALVFALALALALASGLAACGGAATSPAASPSTAAATVTAPAPASPARAGDRTPYTSFPREGSRLILPGPIVFATGGATLDQEASAAALWFLHDYLLARPQVTLLRIEGHGDQAGDDALMLTGERALQVGLWLVDRGVACDRLMAAAFGDTKPVTSADTPEGRARNRRIEAVDAQLRGKAIGGMPVDGSAPAAIMVCE
ncbi:MAG: OmpA family protein [Myxococcales bacterium]|nr:OmpA family protein [Myxococcales bacterium]